MIYIYCLVNPVNSIPFYVGATKVSINTRLSYHIHESKHILPQYRDKKHTFISNLLSTGIRPTARLLYITTLYGAEYYELFFYNMLIKYGFTLLQTEPSGYTKKLISEYQKKCNYIKTNGFVIHYKNSTK